MNKQEMFKTLVEELRNQKTEEPKNKLIQNLKNNYDIPEGVTNSFTVRKLDDKFFETTDIRLITLFIIEAFKVFGRSEKLNEYIPKAEQDEAKQYEFTLYSKNQNMKLPMEITPVVKINDTFGAKLNVKQIAGLLDAGIINYNYDIQREAKLEKRIDQIIKRPTVNQKNIKEMEQLLLNESLKESTIYLNATPKTALEGEELYYDGNEYSLTITEGTRLDILDGYHRILASQHAIMNNPELNFEFSVVFSNFTNAEAIKWQAQHSKATAWSKNRVTEMQQETKSAKVVKTLRDQNSELQSLISTNTGRSLLNSLVTFNYLVDTLDEFFTVTTRSEEVDLVEELSIILPLINEIKEVNGTFKSQIHVGTLLKLYTTSYNRDLDKFAKFLDNVVNYLKENDFNFRLGSNTRENQENSEKNIEILKNEIEKQEGK